MQLFNRTIQARLLAAFGFMVLLTMALGVLSILQLHNLSRLNDELYNHPLMVSNAARDVLADVYAMHRSMKDVVLADNAAQIEQAVALVDAFEQDAFSRFEIIQERYLGDSGDVETTLALFKAWRPIREEVVALAMEGRVDEAEAITKGKGAAHVAVLYASIRSLQDFAQNKADQFYSMVLESRTTAQWQLMLLFSLTVISGAFLALTITRSITRPLATVVTAIKHIARGDTGHSIQVTGRNEIAQLAESFREVQQGLNQKVEIAQRIARGDFSNNIEPISDRDSLGQALHDMAAALKEYTSALVEQNRQLEDQAEKLEQASTIKSQFLANMSHEVRTPLNGVMGMLQLMATTELNREQHEYIDMAADSCKRLTNLIGDILDISRIEAGVLAISSEPFSLAAVLDEVQGLFGPAAELKGVEFNVTRGPGIPDQLVGDSNRLRQVLFNLVGNALKFTEHGSVKVTVSLLGDQGDPNTLRLLFTVQDTGTGIPDKLLDDIFEPFVQAEVSYQRNYQGAGLGLPICKELVRLMHGAMAVDNLETGTTMHVSLPFSLPQDAARDQALGKAGLGMEARPKGCRILLVDDDRVGRLAVARLLDRQGYVIQEAEHGRQALAALMEEDFDCVLMDVQMPVLDGVEATRIIRCSPEFRDKAAIPIIAVTAYAMAEDRSRCLAAGMDEFLPKPVQADSIAHVLDRVLSGKSDPHVYPC